MAASRALAVAAGRDRDAGYMRKSNVNAPAQQNGYAYDDDIEEGCSDPEDYVDNISDDALLSDILRERPREADGIEAVIVVDNVPKVGADRIDKLQNVIKRIFLKFGKIVSEYFPQDEDGQTKGYIFLEYSNPRSAIEAVKTTDGYKLDKLHTFHVNLFTDFDKYAAVPDEWDPPVEQPYKNPGNLKYWLEESHCRDQYTVIYEGGEKTAIFLNSKNEPTMIQERARWTETYVRWSPQGTCLATIHQRGVALWGGRDFAQIMKFMHTGVQLIDFSPCERYLITMGPATEVDGELINVYVWDIQTGEQKRGFYCEHANIWPIFKWSHDGNFFARMSENTISIYETPLCGLHDKKSVKVNGVREFSWSPTDNILSHWVEEDKDVPARVTLTEIPSRKELAVKNLFSVADCKMHWHSDGDYLCVKVDRYAKKKEGEGGEIKYSGYSYNFEIFHIREKQIPVDKIEMKEMITAFAWEPHGHKFAVVHGESPRISASFYTIKPKVEKIKTFEKRAANSLFWSPTGQFIVVAGLRTMNGVLEFIDTSDMTLMCQAEHFMATDVEWDPTGRFVATVVSWWGHKVDNAYWLWSFQGRPLHKQALERCCALIWRPRPPCLLDKDQIKSIKKNLKKYAPGFEMEDRMEGEVASKEQLEKRQLQKRDFETYRKKKKKEYDIMKEDRLSLRDGVDTDLMESEHVEKLEEEAIEFFLKEEETIIGEE